jgi:hypothetical protein
MQRGCGHIWIARYPGEATLRSTPGYPWFPPYVEKSSLIWSVTLPASAVDPTPFVACRATRVLLKSPHTSLDSIGSSTGAPWILVGTKAL